ncbi:MAG TPA: hypothetical protein VHU83_14435 [Bryobacteraceae bacterium]|nr:hypothetical protein [Bryobacteraceae bacterium]
MKNLIFRRVVAGAGFTLALLATGYSASPGKESAGLRTSAPVTPNWPCSFGVPAIGSTIPNDAPLTDQPTVNCFAWQEFIALNWAAQPGHRGVADPSATPAQFGTPSATAPTVWETYKADTEVMLPGAATPKAWNDPPPSPTCSSGGRAAAALAGKPGTRLLSMTSAFGDFSLDQTSQASRQWLADQNGNLVYYEIKLNQDEFNTIVNNQFYNATTQQTTASTGKNPSGGAYQVQLPSGCLQGSCPNNGQPITGAIELKAAWRVLTNPNQYSRYLTSQAVLVNNGVCTNATMGLVGLHIIHKTVTQPQFIWATFEQVDNLPPASPATFSPSSCQCQAAIPNTCFKTPPASPVYQNCLSSQSQGQSCTPNTPPPYNAVSAGCAAYPIQVARYRPISNNSTDPVVATNTAAQQLITNSNPNSVFQYYQLVDVLWSTSPQSSYNNQPGQPGPKTPLSMSGATPDPSALPVANTTMETYVQTLTCLSCHVNANTSGGGYASDFSFVLGGAYAPGLAAARAHRRRSLPQGLVQLKH